MDTYIQNISNEGYWKAYNTNVVQANPGDMLQPHPTPMMAAPPRMVQNQPHGPQQKTPAAPGWIRK